jgi:hypothetical protein
LIGWSRALREALFALLPRGQQTKLASMRASLNSAETTLKSLQKMLTSAQATATSAQAKVVSAQASATSVQTANQKLRNQLNALNPATLPGMSWLTHLTSSLQFAGNMIAAMEKEGFIPDVAIGHDTTSLEALDTLQKKFGTIGIFDAIEMPVLSQRSGTAYRTIGRLGFETLQPHIDAMIHRTNRIITVGPAIGRRISEIYGREIEVVLNSRCGGTVERSDILRDHVGAAKGDTLALFGNLIGQDYGFDEVVQALPHLPENMKLVNIGGFTGKAYTEKAKAEIERTGLSHRVLYGETVPFDKVPTFFSGAAFGIIGFKPVTDNLKYALPNRFFDYCVAGIPVFTTEIEDIAHLVRRYDIGAVFPDLQPQTIADTILSNLGNLDRWRANCAKIVEDIRWEAASRDFVGSLPGSKLQIALLIKKDITNHGRTHRFYRSLVDAGHDVHVYAVRGVLPEGVGMRDVVHVSDGLA